MSQLTRQSQNELIDDSRHSVKGSPTITLRLIGAPAISTPTGWDAIRPRKAFQLLVLSAFANNLSIDRSEAAKKLWPALAPSKQADCLRPCLSRLRKELLRIGLGEALIITDTTIALAAKVESDVTYLLHSDDLNWNDSYPQLLRPALAGWETSVADSIRAEIEVALARRVEKLLQSSPDMVEKWQPTVDQFLQAYPFNARITAQYYSLLKRNGFAQTASELFERFEIGWLDEYGQQDLPDLAAIGERAEQIGLQPPPTHGVLSILRRAPFQATIAGIAIYIVLMYTFSKMGDSERPNQQIPQSYERSILRKGSLLPKSPRQQTAPKHS